MPLHAPRPRGGRPATIRDATKVEVRVDGDVAERLRFLSEVTCRPVSSLVREGIQAILDKYANPAPIIPKVIPNLRTK